MLLPRLREYQVEPVERHPVDVPLPLRPAPPHEAAQAGRRETNMILHRSANEADFSDLIEIQTRITDTR